MANGKTNKEPKVNKLTRGTLDREPGIDGYQAEHRRQAGVEIRPAGKGSGNRKY